jgi:hypothetical protein
LSPGYFNTVEEIDIILHALKEIAEMKLPMSLPKTGEEEMSNRVDKRESRKTIR